MQCRILIATTSPLMLNGIMLSVVAPDEETK